MKNYLLLFIISTILFLCGCVTLKKDKPLKQLNFRDHDWQLIYIENKENLDGNFSQNIWLLNDSRVIDSLKSEYKCVLKSQGDGNHEYQLYSFKDNLFNDWNIFNSKKYFSLGKLKPQLIPVNTSYINCQSRGSVKKICDSLNQAEIIYTISPKYLTNKNLDENAIKINLQINKKSSLFQNKDTGLNDWITASRKELERLYPELTLSDLSFRGSNELSGLSAPGDQSDFDKNGSNGNSGLEAIITADHLFLFNTPILKETDLFLHCDICTMYVITVYKKR